MADDVFLRTEILALLSRPYHSSQFSENCEFSPAGRCLAYRPQAYPISFQAYCISLEEGKTIDDAMTEVVRATDMIESACGIPNTSGQYVSLKSTESHTIHEPLVSSDLYLSELERD